MNYNEFKDEVFYNEFSEMIKKLKIIYTGLVCGCIYFFLSNFGDIGKADAILSIFTFLLVGIIISAFCFFFSLPLILKDRNTLKKTENIRNRLFIDELPVDVDLADYFKQREIELLEAETNNNYDLLKDVYLRGGGINEL